VVVVLVVVVAAAVLTYSKFVSNRSTGWELLLELVASRVLAR
jgi:hypothetical protein